MLRRHSNARVNKCGDFLSLRVPWPKDTEEWNNRIDEELAVLDTWRSLHAYPLDEVFKLLADRALRIDQSAILSHRLKRYHSIRLKLQNEPHMTLTTMQDIAGCRAVLSSVEQAYKLKHVYEKYAEAFPKRGPELISKWTKDYVLYPKPDGYRSIHIVLKHRTKDAEVPHCSGLRVELQIRSRFQHAWAMAVETASAVTNQALKSGKGGDDWRRFFNLMGDFIALQEKCPLSSGIVDGEIALRKEAARLAAHLKVIPLLEGMSHVIETFSGSGQDDMYLVLLDSRKRRMRYLGFKESQFGEATEQYAREERKYKDNFDVHVVLAGVKSIKQLRSAYPSYFLDSARFIELVKEVFQ